MRLEDLFALPLAVYRLQLSAAATAVAWWYVVVRALWLPREAMKAQRRMKAGAT